jgi:hypothetical protein
VPKSKKNNKGGYKKRLGAYQKDADIHLKKNSQWAGK